MRIFFTILFAIFFIPAFYAFFTMDSVVTYSLDTDAVVRTMKTTDLRGAILDVIDESINDQLKKEAMNDVEKYIITQTRTKIGDIITEDWLYESVAKAHKGFIDFLETGEDTGKIDIREVKGKLEKVLLDLGRDTVNRCNELVKTAICDRLEEKEQAFNGYRSRVIEALKEIPDETNFTSIIDKSKRDLKKMNVDIDLKQDKRSKDFDEMREGLKSLKIIRWIGIGGLIFLLLIIALINMKSLGRVMIAVGIVTLLASGLYIGTINPLGKAAHEVIDKELTSKTDRSSKDIKVEDDSAATTKTSKDTAETTANKIMLQAFNDAYGRSNRTVTIILIASAIVFFMGFFFRKPAEESGKTQR